MLRDGRKLIGYLRSFDQFGTVLSIYRYLVALWFLVHATGLMG